MKICIIGLGSIGKKHLGNIRTVLSKSGITVQADALRSSGERTQEDRQYDLSAVYYSYDELPSDYDVIFVTNPTSAHFETIRRVASKTKHLFIEKPLFHNTDCKTSDLGLKNGGVYYVACPLRYKSVMQRAKEIVSKERIYAVRAICSSYLPDWRKNVDYRKVYSARRELGGGVVLDLIHEWDYLIWLFGRPEEVTMMQGTYSELAIDTEDLAVYLARYPDKLVELHLDYFGRRSVRTLELYCRENTITIDILSNRIVWSNTKVIKEEALPDNDFYLDEMNNFLDMVLLGTPNENSIEWAYDTLRIAKGELQKA